MNVYWLWTITVLNGLIQRYNSDIHLRFPLLLSITVNSYQPGSQTCFSAHGCVTLTVSLKDVLNLKFSYRVQIEIFTFKGSVFDITPVTGFIFDVILNNLSFEKKMLEQHQSGTQDCFLWLNHNMCYRIPIHRCLKV